jgi:hypothetical protein
MNGNSVCVQTNINPFVYVVWNFILLARGLAMDCIENYEVSIGKAIFRQMYQYPYDSHLYIAYREMHKISDIH